MQKILIILFITANFAANIIVFSQDTTKKKIDTAFKPLTFIISENKYNYINPVNPDTVTRKRFLWHPLKSLDDIFNYLPGYYLKNMDVGQINNITFNGLSSTGVLRHGRPINDLIDGSIDMNLLSRNEIAEIEVSNGFGNSVYNYANTVNIIQRQQFQFRPYTELAFWQDRYDNEYIDANFSQNFFNGFNFNFGMTKHSYTGKYTHSYFDKWLGRFNFNFAPSNKLNFFLYSNYAKIDRGLNEGIDAGKVNISNKETLFNPTLAVVRNPDAYENRERFDIDAGALLLAGKNSFTKLQLFVSNSMRHYRDPDINGFYLKSNLHWIDYGIKLKEELRFTVNRDINIFSNSELEVDYIIKQYNQSLVTIASMTGNSKYSKVLLLQNVDLMYKNFVISGFINGEKYSYYNKIDFYGGLKGEYSVKFDSAKSLSIYSVYNSFKQYSNSGINFQLGKSSVKAEFYFYKYYSDSYTKGVNASGSINITPVNFDFNVSKSFDPDKNKTVPEYYGNLELSYHDLGIKNKLEFKIGLNTRFWSKHSATGFSGQSNMFYSYLNPDALTIPANATFDFFIIGKINKATFGLTFENLLDRAVYNTGVYPAIDRGGLFNVLSRFNITWYFFD